MTIVVYSATKLYHFMILTQQRNMALYTALRLCLEELRVHIGVVGLGAMGGAMAQHLLEMGQSVIGYDISEKSMALSAQTGVPTTTSLDQLAAHADLIVLSLPNAEAVEAVIMGFGDSLRAGTIILDTTTSDPVVTKKLSTALATRDIHLLDAPVSGGPSGARAGTMTMLLAGDIEAINRASPITDCMAGKTVIVGESGAGHVAKIANNMLCAANLVLVAEAARIAEAIGISTTNLLEGVNAGSGRSGVSEVNFPKWVLSNKFNSGFTMGLMRKDVRLATHMADCLGIDIPAFAQIARIWEASAETLPDSADFNAIAKP